MSKHSIKLTPQQKAAFTAIKDFIISKDDQYLRFSGAAGTGKSTLLSQVLLYLKNEHSDLKVAVASPTNKALKNIRLMANKTLETDASQYFAFYTLASILGLYLDINIYTGNDYLRTGFGAIAICKYDLVIIDEYSMIDRKTLHLNIKASDIKEVRSFYYVYLVIFKIRRRPTFVGKRAIETLVKSLSVIKPKPILKFKPKLKPTYQPITYTKYGPVIDLRDPSLYEYTTHKVLARTKIRRGPYDCRNRGLKVLEINTGKIGWINNNLPYRRDICKGDYIRYNGKDIQLIEDGQAMALAF